MAETATPARRGDQVLPPEDRGQAVQHLPDDATRAEVARAGKVTRAKRRHDVLQLAVAGLGPEEIAERLSESYEKQGLQQITKPAVEGIIRSTLTTWRESDLQRIENVRALQLQRLDRAMEVLWLKVLDGNLKAHDRYYRLEALRAKIAGTEAPRRMEVSGSIGLHADQEAVQREEEAWKSSADNGLIEGTATEVTDGDGPADKPD
jgi:hypothetical protein